MSSIIFGCAHEQAVKILAAGQLPKPLPAGKKLRAAAKTRRLGDRIVKYTFQADRFFLIIDADLNFIPNANTENAVGTLSDSDAVTMGKFTIQYTYFYRFLLLIIIAGDERGRAPIILGGSAPGDCSLVVSFDRLDALNARQRSYSLIIDSRIHPQRNHGR